MTDVTRHQHARALVTLAFGVATVGLSSTVPVQAEESAWEDKPYTVVDGKVDANTYNGYRRYDNSCLRCHGPDGAGSSYAPALVESLQRISYEQFVETVVYGKKDVSTSQQLVMPAFGEVEDVVNYIDDIYSYLKARADGVLGRGRPERAPN